MNDNIETQKICPSCHQRTKSDNNYCSYCGASLEGIEPEKVEKVRISDTSESNKVEIVKKYKMSKYASIFGAILTPFIIIGFLILGLFIHPLVFLAILIAFIIFTPFIICLWIGILRMKASCGQTRKFSISDQEIKITIPNKFTFQIKWSQFDTIHIIKTMGEDYGGFTPYGGGLHTDFYNFHFFSKNQSAGIFVIETDVDFSTSDTKKIKSLIEQYANRLNKEVIWEKKAWKRKLKEKDKIITPSTPAIQTIPEGSDQMSITQSQQITPSIICPYCGNTNTKQNKFTWSKFILGNLCIFPIIILIISWIISWIFFNSAFNFIVFTIFLLICWIINVVGVIKQRNYILGFCPQCKNNFKIKKEPQNV
jgi:RNA polymerase subunit RPABC4/transcription elongation factor Spt4